jgi:hypothetical protein
MYNIIVNPALEYSSEPWVLREGDKNKPEASRMRFLLPPLGVSLAGKIRITDMGKHFGTEGMVKEI